MALLLAPAGAFAHGDVHERIDALTLQIQAHPNAASNAPLFLARGDLHRIHGSWAEAAADFDKALQLDPKLVMVELFRARLWLDTDKPKAAIEAVNRYAASQPLNSETLALRARARVKAGEPLAAVEDFTRAIRLAVPPTPELYLERAEALLATGPERRGEALRGLEEGIARLGPLVTLELRAVDVELALKRFEGALARIDLMASKAARKETWLSRRAEVLRQAGREAEARQAWQEVLAALETLPPARRQTKAMMDLEARARAGLKTDAPVRPTPGHQ